MRKSGSHRHFGTPLLARIRVTAAKFFVQDDLVARGFEAGRAREFAVGVAFEQGGALETLVEGEGVEVLTVEVDSAEVFGGVFAVDGAGAAVADGFIEAFVVGVAGEGPLGTIVVVVAGFCGWLSGGDDWGWGFVGC